jgi:hypothetical protein
MQFLTPDILPPVERETIIDIRGDSCAAPLPPTFKHFSRLSFFLFLFFSPPDTAFGIQEYLNIRSGGVSSYDPAAVL